MNLLIRPISVPYLVTVYRYNFCNGTSIADPDPSDPYVLGLLDQDPGPLVRGTSPDPDPSKQK